MSLAPWKPSGPSSKASWPKIRSRKERQPGEEMKLREIVLKGEVLECYKDNYEKSSLAAYDIPWRPSSLSKDYVQVFIPSTSNQAID